MNIIADVSNILHRKFAQKFIPSLIKAAAQYFELIPDPIIKQIQQEHLAQIRKDLELIVQRVYTIQGKYKIMEQFELDVYGRFMRSSYLQLRINGLKRINTMIRQILLKQNKSLTEDYVIDWINRKHLIEEIVGVKCHQQILTRTGPLLQFMYKKDSLNIKVLESLWELSNDELLKNDLFRVLCEIEFGLDSKELEFFASKIVNMEPSRISEEALRMIFEPCKKTCKPNEQLMKYTQILLGIIFNTKCSAEVSESALKKCIEILSPLPYDPYKKNILLISIHSTINKNTVLTLKLIRQLLDKCNNRSEAISYLINDENLITIFFTNLKAYYKQDNKGKHNHLQNINEHINFLGYLLTNSPPTYKLPIAYYYELWEILIDGGNLEVMFKFMMQIASSTSSVFVL